MNLETTVIVALIAAVPTIVSAFFQSRSQKKRDEIAAKKVEDESKAADAEIAAETARVATEKEKADAEIASLVAQSEKDVWERTQAMMQTMADDLEAERVKRRDVEVIVRQQAERISVLEKSDRRKDSVIEEQAERIAALEKSDRLKGVVIEKQASQIAVLEEENKTLRHENTKIKNDSAGGSKRTL